MSTHQSGYFGIRIAICFLVAYLIPVVTQTQVQGQSSKTSQDSAASAAVQGSIQDAGGRPVADVTVYLQGNVEAEPVVTRTDSLGKYRFSALRNGVYSLRAEKEGYGKATFGPWALGQQQTKTVDFTLAALDASAQAHASSPTPQPETGQVREPEFFDEPAFTVAGVTDTSNLGGHGSNVVARNTEALAQQTASLNRESPAKPQPGSSPPLTGEKSLREALERQPDDFTANHQLGRMLLADGKAGEALPYLEYASRLNPGDYQNAHDLARAYADAGRSENARDSIRALLIKAGESTSEAADLHHLLGDVEEKRGNSLEAVREYQRAAELDPSESYLFDWGAELLMHRAAEPAIEVFGKGKRSFPRSTRMLIGLGVAWYAHGSYDQAAQRLCQASDLNPDDPSPYLFIGKMQAAETAQSDCMAPRMERFAHRQPEDALANYYYALSLWKRWKNSNDLRTLAEIQARLERAVQLDPRFGAAYLQLGIVYWERHDFPQAISAYQKAIAADPESANPESEEAHYRLGQAYQRTGEASKAQEELKVYEQLSKKTQEQFERQRHKIQQFVYTLRNPLPVSQPPE